MAVPKDEFHLNEILSYIAGPSHEQLKVWNQYAAVALEYFHDKSKVKFNFSIDGERQEFNVIWDSDFSKDAMREKKDLAHFGGIALAIFVMSILYDYKYLIQSEIGEGVDYNFLKERPSSLNFMAEGHFVEISGILQESGSNTIRRRIKEKHDQILSGTRSNSSSSVIVTLFKDPLTIKEIHI